METTLNIHADILEKINIGAQASGMTRSRFIVCLIQKVMQDITNPECIGSMVRYQKRKPLKEWNIFHLQLQLDEYEYFLDLRKLLKMSVSLILAYAVKKFLDKKIREKLTDNYQTFHNYIIAKEVIDNIICWKLIWGFPPNLNKFIRF